jgi:hypothetical protein
VAVPTVPTRREQLLALPAPVGSTAVALQLRISSGLRIGTGCEIQSYCSARWDSQWNRSLSSGRSFLPEFCGPNELARSIESYWTWEDDNAVGRKELAEINARARGPLRGEPVLQLFKLAYDASFLKNEGRHTRCDLLAAGTHDPVPRKIVQFPKPLPLEGPEMLRHLAPTVMSNEHALSIVKVNDAICCDGIFLMNEAEADVEVPEVSVRNSGGHHGLSVAILDPGEIAVREGIFSARLRGNRLVKDMSMFFAPLVQVWLDECGKRVHQKCMGKDSKALALLRLAPYGEILWLWSKLISTARDLKHGGCVVLVDNPRPDCIDLKFPTTAECLTDRLADYWLACGQAIKLKDQDGFAAAVQECNRFRHVLFSAVRAIAALSATDGCVVLDRTLTLLGFGCVIQTSGKNSTRTPLDWQTREQLSVDATRKQGGTRHRSAFDLCNCVSNTLVFLISQDGGIRVFSNDDKHVFLSGPLDSL